MTTYPDGLYQFGGVPVPMGGIPPGGTHYWVNPSHALASDGNIGTDPNAPLSTLAAAEDKCVANRHDTVHYVAGSSGLTLTAALTWDKNYTHLIGHAAPTRVAQRTRIFQLSTLTGASPLVDITASGCIFSNLYIFQGVDDATSLINVRVRGGRNYFWNVHFAGGGHATQAIDGGASLALISDSNGSCEENTFHRCTIGVDTADAATGMVALTFDGEAHRNTFDDCVFRMRAGSTGAAFIEVLDATGIDRDNPFYGCHFHNNSTSNDMASAVLAPAGMGEPRQLYFDSRCTFTNVTKIDANDRGIVFGNMVAGVAADLAGVAAAMYE
jgi:hypothetical protein